MLGAILCQYRLEASGPAHGIGPSTSTGVPAGTAWNKNWAIDYGPDVDKAKKASKMEVQEAMEALVRPDDLPVYFEEAQEIVERRSLASDLIDDEKIVVMTSYYAYQRWLRDEDDVAAVLLLI
jgi:hypothetical protein